METLVLLCTVVLSTALGVGLGAVCLLAFLGFVSRMVAPEPSAAGVVSSRHHAAAHRSTHHRSRPR